MPKIELEEISYKSKRFKVITQKIKFGSKRETREILQIGNGVSIVVLDRDNNVCLIKEWRSVFDKDIYLLPGGFCGSDNDKALKKAAIQEVDEELGLSIKAADLTKIKSFYPLGSVRNTLSVYLARVDKFAEKSQSETFEDIKLAPMPFEEAYKRFVLGGELTTSATIIGLTVAKNYI